MRLVRVGPAGSETLGMTHLGTQRPRVIANPAAVG